MGWRAHLASNQSVAISTCVHGTLKVAGQSTGVHLSSPPLSLPYPPLVHPTLYHIIELRTHASSSSFFGFSSPFLSQTPSFFAVLRPDRRTFSTIDITNPSRPFSIPTFTTLRRINGLYLTAFGNGWLPDYIYIYIYTEARKFIDSARL